VEKVKCVFYKTTTQPHNGHRTMKNGK